MPIRARTDKLTVMLSEGERAMLSRLCESSGLSIADELRQYIRRAHAERFGELAPKAAKGRKR